MTGAGSTERHLHGAVILYTLELSNSGKGSARLNRKGRLHTGMHTHEGAVPIGHAGVVPPIAPSDTDAVSS